MNRVNSRSDHGHEDSTISIVTDYYYYYYYYYYVYRPYGCPCRCTISCTAYNASSSNFTSRRIYLSKSGLRHFTTSCCTVHASSDTNDRRAQRHHHKPSLMNKLPTTTTTVRVSAPFCMISFWRPKWGQLHSPIFAAITTIASAVCLYTTASKRQCCNVLWNQTVDIMQMRCKCKIFIHHVTRSHNNIITSNWGCCYYYCYYYYFNLFLSPNYHSRIHYCKFYISLDTKQVILEMFFLAILLA